MIEQRPVEHGDDARRLICELGAHFYRLGWVSGTGGGISIRHRERIYMAPSGVLKESLTPEMIFELDGDGEVVAGPPAESGLRVSECRPLFLHAYRERGAGAVLHSHSKWPVLASMLASDHIEFADLEMLKGLEGVGNRDRHLVPVIENTEREAQLADRLAAAIAANPHAYAVVVRNHGVYVWGRDWIAAKRHAECYDYLFNVHVEMRRLGIDQPAGI